MRLSAEYTNARLTPLVPLVPGGCGGGNYCPLSNNTRGQMAAFITKTFNLR